MVIGALPPCSRKPPATPLVVIRPILAGIASAVNQRLPGAPAAMLSAGMLTQPICGAQNSPSAKLVKLPSGVTRTTAPAASANQRLPSLPAVMPRGEPVPDRGNSTTVPDVVIRPTVSRALSVNHRWPSGPAVMP